MDISRFSEELAGILFQGGEDRFQLQVRRAFPWSKGGGGIVEYEGTVPGRDDGEDRVVKIHARLGSDREGASNRLIGSRVSPLGSRERELFFAGERSLRIDPSGMILSVFPFADRMPWLGKLLDPAGMSDCFGEIAGGKYGEGKSFVLDRPEVAGYRFGRRCTVRYRLLIRDASGNEVIAIPVIGKSHRDGRGRAVFNHLEQLWNWQFESAGTRPPIISRPLGYGPDFRIYFQEAPEGLDLYRIEGYRERGTTIAMAGRLLSSLHTSGIRIEGSYVPEDELSLIRKWSRYLRPLRPELEGMIGSILRSIQRSATVKGIDRFEPSIAHRDFHDKQVIAVKDKIYFIDFDTATMADPAIDVGNFLAHLVLRGFQRKRRKEAVKEESELFLSSYRSGNPGVGGERIDFYFATSLFRLACLYAFRPAWENLAAPLLEACRESLPHSVTRAAFSR